MDREPMEHRKIYRRLFTLATVLMTAAVFVFVVGIATSQPGARSEMAAMAGVFLLFAAAGLCVLIQALAVGEALVTIVRGLLGGRTTYRAAGAADARADTPALH